MQPTWSARTDALPGLLTLAPHIVGVSGSGKSTVGRALSERLRLPFCEGDDLHPTANVAKLRAGVALDDADRAPWLARINSWLRDQAQGGIVSCSALKRAYRARLQSDLMNPIRFVLLDPPREVLVRRLAGRTGHFMSGNLLDSQLETLERPYPGEHALQLTGIEAPDLVVERVVAWLS